MIGGIVGGGLVGSYYGHSGACGRPSFVRSEPRIDFDWKGIVRPGGTIDPDYLSVDATGFSARWTGTIVPATSDAYTFRFRYVGGVFARVRLPGSTDWTTLFDAWSDTRSDAVAAMALVAGKSYVIAIDYYASSADSCAQLYWSSPSLPEQILDCASQAGINNPAWDEAYADLVKGARNHWNAVGSTPLAVGTDGWPASDALYVYQESISQGLGIDPLMRGTVAYSFNGSAKVALNGNVVAGSVTTAYDPATNTTSGTFRTSDLNVNASSIVLTGARRDGKPTGPPGITNLKLMRPVAPDAASTYPTSTLFTPQILDQMGRFTLIRYQLVGSQDRDWSDRTPPGFFNQATGVLTAPHLGVGNPTASGASWEYKVMLANAAGRDLMLSVPVPASDDYFRNLALLIRYGSDGVNPYTSDQANPAYPPLNPNLRVYLEIANELWNWNVPYYTDWANINALVTASADANDATFAVFNYDNLSTVKTSTGAYGNMLNGKWRHRYIIMRMIQISGIFRSAFGDAAMMTRIRPLYEWQYDNAGGTASFALDFVEMYYNNGDGVRRSAVPRPASYHIWGGGGATYYGLANRDGLTDLMPDPGFESVQVGAGYGPAPPGTPWAFVGAAGIARMGPSTVDIPPAFDGSQVGYIADKSSIAARVAFPSSATSNVYAVAVKAVNRTRSGAAAADRQTLRVYLDGVDITAKYYSQQRGWMPPGYSASAPWKSRTVGWMLSNYYVSNTFTVDPGSTHTIEIRGVGDPGNPAATDQIAFVDGVRIASIDSILGDPRPVGGSALGQVSVSSYQGMLNTEASWALAYGLQFLAYEGGWSLGGDDLGSPLQNWAKFADQRAGDVQAASLAMFAAAGGALSVLGTYPQWPAWSDTPALRGLIGPASSTLQRGTARFLAAPTPDPTNGVVLPATMTATAAALVMNTYTNTIRGAGGWFGWNVIAPASGPYAVTLATAVSKGVTARVEILVDGVRAGIAGAGGATLAGTITLSAGLHSIRVISLSAGWVSVVSLAIVPG